MAKSTGRKSTTGFIAAGLALSVPFGMTTTAVAQTTDVEIPVETEVETPVEDVETPGEEETPSEPVDTEKPPLVEEITSEAEDFPFIYSPYEHGETNDLTIPGTSFIPKISDVSPVNFIITKAEDENGNDITDKLSINTETGEVTVTESIGDKDTLFYHIEVSGTYPDGSNHVDTIFVINDSVTHALPAFSVPLGETLTLSNDVLDHYTKVGDNDTSYVYAENTPSWVMLGNGLTVKTEFAPGETDEEKTGEYTFDILRIDNTTGKTTTIPVHITITEKNDTNPLIYTLDEKTTVFTQGDLAQIASLNLAGPVFETTEETPNWATIDDEGNLTINTNGETVTPGTYEIPLLVHSASTPEEKTPLTLTLTVLSDKTEPGLPTDPGTPPKNDPNTSSLTNLNNIERLVHGLTFAVALNIIIENLQDFDFDPETNIKKSLHAFNKDLNNLKHNIENFPHATLDNLQNFQERRDQRLQELGLKEIFDKRQAEKTEDDHERFDQEKINRLINVLKDYKANKNTNVPDVTIDPTIDNSDINVNTTPNEDNIIFSSSDLA